MAVRGNCADGKIHCRQLAKVISQMKIRPRTWTHFSVCPFTVVTEATLSMSRVYRVKTSRMFPAQETLTLIRGRRCKHLMLL